VLERGPVGRRSVHREDELDGPGEQRREPGHDLLAGDAGPQRLVQRKAGADVSIRSCAVSGGGEYRVAPSCSTRLWVSRSCEGAVRTPASGRAHLDERGFGRHHT